MAKLRFAEALEALPVLVPATAANDTARVSSFVDLSLAHWVTFVCNFGLISVTDTGLITVVVEGSTTGQDSDSETNVDFSYRIGNIISAAPTKGTITYCESTNTNTVASTDVASGLLIIDVDPAEAQYRYVRVSLDPAADTTSWVVGIVAYKEPRYPGNTLPSNFTST